MCLWAGIVRREYLICTRKAQTLSPSKTLDWAMKFDHTNMVSNPLYQDAHFIVNLRDWHWLLGWATINNVIFGLGQGRLAWIASRQRGGDGQGEQDPLLA